MTETANRAPFPCWRDLSAEQYRERIGELIETIIAKVAARRAATGIEPLDPAAILGRALFGAAPQKFVVGTVNVGAAPRNSSSARGKFNADLRGRNSAFRNFDSALESFEPALGSLKSALGSSKSALRNFNSALGKFGLAECIAELFFRSADLSNGGSEISMQLSVLVLASASLPQCCAEFFFPSAGLAECSADYFFRSAGLKLWIADLFFGSAGLK